LSKKKRVEETKRQTHETLTKNLKGKLWETKNTSFQPIPKEEEKRTNTDQQKCRTRRKIIRIQRRKKIHDTRRRGRRGQEEIKKIYTGQN
jgi:hypothetical protein